MGRPLKLKILSLRTSTKLLEDRTKRDPDHLDKASFAKQLDHLLHKLVDMDVPRKEIVDLLIEGHKASGYDLQRAYVDDVVAFAINLIMSKKQIPADIESSSQSEEASSGDKKNEAEPARAEAENSSENADKLGGGRESTFLVDVKETTGSNVEAQTVSSGALHIDDEALKHGAVGRHTDGVLIFGNQKNADEYYLRTGEPHYLRPSGPAE